MHITHEYLVYEYKPAYPQHGTHYDAICVCNQTWYELCEQFPPTLVRHIAVGACTKAEAIRLARNTWRS